MKSGTQDQVEGTFRNVMGKIKEIVGIISMNPALEDKGKIERQTGALQGKVGQIKKVLGK